MHNVVAYPIRLPHIKVPDPVFRRLRCTKAADRSQYRTARILVFTSTCHAGSLLTGALALLDIHPGTDRTVAGLLRTVLAALGPLVPLPMAMRAWSTYPDTPIPPPASIEQHRVC